jgi:hypothetical protein
MKVEWELTWEWITVALSLNSTSILGKNQLVLERINQELLCHMGQGKQYQPSHAVEQYPQTNVDVFRSRFVEVIGQDNR